ncbi:MAG: hypothetical protein AAB380_00150, partial [Verrucomicrobiota bacterium]
MFFHKFAFGCALMAGRGCNQTVLETTTDGCTTRMPRNTGGNQKSLLPGVQGYHPGMKNRFRLYRRKKGRRFYVENCETGKQQSLGTRDRAEATAILLARNESFRQPQLNLQIAKAYLAGTDSGITTRTWQHAFAAITETKH